MLNSVLPKWDPSMSIPFHMVTVWAYKTHLTVVFQKCGSYGHDQNLESAGVNIYIYTLYIYCIAFDHPCQHISWVSFNMWYLVNASKPHFLM